MNGSIVRNGLLILLSSCALILGGCNSSEQEDDSSQVVDSSPSFSFVPNSSKPSTVSNSSKPLSEILNNWETYSGIKLKEVPIPAKLTGKVENAYKVTFGVPSKQKRPVLKLIDDSGAKIGDTAQASVYVWADKKVKLDSNLVFQIGRNGSTPIELTNKRIKSLNKTPRLIELSHTFKHDHDAIRFMISNTGLESFSVYIADPVMTR